MEDDSAGDAASTRTLTARCGRLPVDAYSAVAADASDQKNGRRPDKRKAAAKRGTHRQ